MKVILNNKVYKMTRKQADGLMEAASRYIVLGIYAIEKDGIIELRKDKCSSKTQLKRMIHKFKEKGFRVYSNGQ